MNLNVNLNLYRNFYYVVKYGGFTKASIEISLSQSTLSNNVKKLEEELNIKLFRRVGTKVKLTKDGEMIYQKLEQIYKILSSSNEEKKNLNLGCLRFIADNYLCEGLTKFSKNNNNLKLIIQISDSSNLYQMLKRNELDLVITRYPTFYRFEESIIIEEICRTENIFVCSKKFYQQNHEKFKKEDYCFPMILPNQSEKRRVIEKYLQENNYNYSTELELPNSNLLKKLVLSDIGIGYMNKLFVSDEISNGDLVCIDTFQNAPEDIICLLYNKNKITKEVKELINTIKSTIQKTNN